jgi:hypothetical protein
MEIKMKLSIALSTLLVAGFVAAGVEPASAVVYCQYVEYPVGCTVRAGVVPRPRPVARAVATPGVGPLDIEALKCSGRCPETKPCSSSS